MVWQGSIVGLGAKRVYAMGDAKLGEAFASFSGPKPVKTERQVIGRFELLGKQ